MSRVRFKMHVTYGFHDVLSRGANFHRTVSELDVIREVCADLALFSSTKRLSTMIRSLRLGLTVGTLKIAI